jgi:hypothetical protein
MLPEIAGNLPPLAVTLREARRISGLGYTTLWKLRKAGRLRSIKVPGVDRTLIDFRSLQELLGQSAAVAPPARRPGRPRKIVPAQSQQQSSAG